MHEHSARPSHGLSTNLLQPQALAHAFLSQCILLARRGQGSWRCGKQTMPCHINIITRPTTTCIKDPTLSKTPLTHPDTGCGDAGNWTHALGRPAAP